MDANPGGQKGKRIGWRIGVAGLLLLGLATAVSVQESHPGPERQWYNRGLDAAERGDIPGGIQNTERAIAVSPRFLQGYDTLADLYLAYHRPDVTLRVLQKLRQIDPAYPHLSTRTAEAYMGSDDITLLQWARSAVLQEPLSPRARIILALGLARSGNSRDAFIQVATAQELSGSATLAHGLQEAIPAASKPAAMARLLLPLVIAAPY